MFTLDYTWWIVDILLCQNTKYGYLQWVKFYTLTAGVLSLVVHCVEASTFFNFAVSLFFFHYGLNSIKRIWCFARKVGPFYVCDATHCMKVCDSVHWYCQSMEIYAKYRGHATGFDPTRCICNFSHALLCQRLQTICRVKDLVSLNFPILKVSKDGRLLVYLFVQMEFTLYAVLPAYTFGIVTVVKCLRKTLEHSVIFLFGP